MGEGKQSSHMLPWGGEGSLEAAPGAGKAGRGWLLE